MSEIQSEERQEIINGCNGENEEQVEQVRQVVAEVIRSDFSGPIPPPSIIRGYEEVLPGAADRIFQMAEKQSEHRQMMERKMIKAESRDSLLGVLFGFILGISTVIAGVVIVKVVPENSGAISGSILGVAGIGSIIGTFIKGTRSNHNQGNLEGSPRAAKQSIKEKQSNDSPEKDGEKKEIA